MRTLLPRLALLTTLLATSALGVAAPAQAAAPARAAGGQIDGTAFFEAAGGRCPEAPAPYEHFDSYDPLVMEGSLEGCWYTLVEDSKETPSGVYLEVGQELFVGTLDDGAVGTFLTTYKFEAKYAPDGTELHGRCQHPLVAGSGTGGFAGATGRVDFKDIIGEPVTYVYRGHIRLR
jgi:hypothetical protein